MFPIKIDSDSMPVPLASFIGRAPKSVAQVFFGLAGALVKVLYAVVGIPT